MLFLPVSGPGGAGEFYRALAIANGIARRWPDAAIQFVVSRDAPYAHDAPYPTVLVGRSPTLETEAVNEIISQVRPHVVIFDSSGRVAQYECAHRLGARVVFVSSRESSRRRGFRLRRMRWLDQHWIAQPRFLAGDLTAARARQAAAAGRTGYGVPGGVARADRFRRHPGVATPVRCRPGWLCAGLSGRWRRIRATARRCAGLLRGRL